MKKKVQKKKKVEDTYDEAELLREFPNLAQSSKESFESFKKENL